MGLMDLFLSLFSTGWTLIAALIGLVTWAVTAVIATRNNTKSVDKVTVAVENLSKSMTSVSTQIELTKKDVHQIRYDLKNVNQQLAMIPNLNGRLSRVEAQHAMLMQKAGKNVN